jgi:hypothetical protein
MTNSEFYIDISIQTKEGPKRFGRFEFLSDRETAHALFNRLKGSLSIDSKDMLYIEFMELKNGLPVNMNILTCNLQQLGTNTMLITQEVFRLMNLRGYSK